MPIHRGTPLGFPGPLRPRLLLASANQGKLRELRTILDGLPVELVGLAEAGLGEPPEVEETGDTFLENALLKGRAYAAWSGLAAVADDSGLEVDALGGAPGVRSARYAGDGYASADMALWDYGPDCASEPRLVAYATQLFLFTFLD